MCVQVQVQQQSGKHSKISRNDWLRDRVIACISNNRLIGTRWAAAAAVHGDEWLWWMPINIQSYHEHPRNRWEDVISLTKINLNKIILIPYLGNHFFKNILKIPFCVIFKSILSIFWVPLVSKQKAAVCEWIWRLPRCPWKWINNEIFDINTQWQSSHNYPLIYYW